jgi:hypothetical protein
MDTQKTVTRIDLERCGSGLFVRQWFAGWKDDGSTPPDIDEYVPDQTVSATLAQYERQGFTCEMANGQLGRALRGDITRIDFIQLADGWHIRKYPYGWTAKTHPISETVSPTAEDGILWCDAHRWTVRRWPGGARAFKGQPRPIHDKATIQYLRRQVENNQRDGKIDPRRNYDLAFDF